MWYAGCLKRVMDFTVAAIALAALSWLMVAVTLLLHFANHGAGVLFIQDRPGKDGKIFRLFKFKSMNDKCDSHGNLLPNMERLTPIGKFIRRTSIDELPQLLNVLRGDMALIGPRPLLTRYLPCYTERERLRHSVRPGITGWAQVHGRNDLPWNERLELDAWYAEHVSFGLDSRIVWMTIIKVIRHEGTSIEKLVPLDVERKENT